MEASRCLASGKTSVNLKMKISFLSECRDLDHIRGSSSVFPHNPLMHIHVHDIVQSYVHDCIITTMTILKLKDCLFVVLSGKEALNEYLRTKVVTVEY